MIGPSDLVIYMPDPLLLGGELLALKWLPGNQWLVEQVHYAGQDEADGAPPIRAILPDESLMLADVWARAVA